MDLVVGLSKYVGQADIEPVFVEWVAGYKAAGGTLSPDEVYFAPSLIILRVVNNVVYFAGRVLAAEDDLVSLTSRMDMYADRCTWIRQREEWMRGVLAQLLPQGTRAHEAK